MHASGHGTANAHMQMMGFDTLVARFESPERAAWQKPEAVLAALGDIKGKTLIDISAGTGYFSFRAAAAGARVIAADIDPRFHHYIEQRLAKEPPTAPGSIVTRKLAYDSPGLAATCSTAVTVRIASTGELATTACSAGAATITCKVEPATTACSAARATIACLAESETTP